MARTDFTGAKLYVNPLATGNNVAGYANRFGFGNYNSVNICFKTGDSVTQAVSGISSLSHEVNSVRIVCSGTVPADITDSHKLYLGVSANIANCAYYIYVPNGFATGDTYAFEMVLTAPMEPGQSGTT